MKKKNRYCEPTIKLHELKTSNLLQDVSGKLNSNQSYSTQTMNWGNEIEYEE